MPRASRFSERAVQTLGLYGFGAAAHLVAQIAREQGRRVYAFTRPGDVRAQSFARDLGAHSSPRLAHSFRPRSRRCVQVGR